MQDFSISPTEMFTSLWRNRSLIKAAIVRDVLGRYRGSVMGILWSFFNPVFMLAVYTFVFSIIFKARWSVGSDSKAEFALVLFAGLIVFNLFADCINQSPNLILSKPNYVKKVVYPLEILPWVGLGTALFHSIISLGVWLVFYAYIYGLPHVTILYFPIVIIPLGLVIVGLSWALASLGVYLRDVGQFIGILTTMLLFLSPVFYPASRLPEALRPIFYINPLAMIIEQTRDVLFWGKTPDFFELGIYSVAAIVIAWLGFAWFQKTRKGFADVI